MSPLFTEDDVGKRVESAEGEELGVVADVEGETAYVSPDPELADSSRAALDWGRESDETVPLADEAVAELTDDAVVLESSFPDESITTGDVDENDGAGTGPDESDRRDVGSFPESEGAPEPEAGEPGSAVGEVNRGSGRGDVDESEPESAGSEEREGDTERTESPEELDAVEEEASRELEVDPTELTDGEPEAEIEPEEDVGQRTDVGTEPDLPDEDRGPSGPTTEDAGPIETEIDAETERNTDIRERESDESGDSNAGEGESEGEAER